MSQLGAKQASQLFRLHGLSLRPDGLAAVVGAANQSPEPLELARQIVEQVRAQRTADRMVDGRRVAAAVGALRGGAAAGRPTAGPVLEVFDAFELPRLRYDAAQRTYAAAPVARAMHAGADAQRDVYAGRYALVRQRLLRNAQFKRPALEQLRAPSGGAVQLTDIEALQGSVGRQCVLGLLCEPVEGEYHLEDPTGMVPINLSRAETKEGLFTLGCLVLAEGVHSRAGVFDVHFLCFPPAEPRERTRALLDGLCAFGGGAPAHSDDARAQLLARADDAMMVVVSDCWLDRDDALAALGRLLDGYEAVAASCGDGDVSRGLAFVLCGNFTAQPLPCAEMHGVRALFDRLGDMIRARPTLAAHAHFVLLPGPRDLVLGAGEALPRSRLPRVFTRGLEERVAHVHFASCPARMRFFGRELVLVRDDLVVHMRRNAIVEPAVQLSAEMSEHLVKTVVDQAHLRPAIVSEHPVHWSYDHALQLPYTPDALVLADANAFYECTYAGCVAFNPGTLLAEHSWMVYRPGPNSVEFSKL